MRTFAGLIFVLVACSPTPAPVAAPAAAAPTAPTAPAGEAPASAESAKPETRPVDAAAEALAADTPKTTVAGNMFIAPAEWTLRVRGNGTILEAPEGQSFIAIYDLAEARDADDAVTQAWTAYKGKVPFAQITSVAAADSDGWSKIRGYSYDVPPNLKRAIGANARWANGAWTVVLFDAAQAVAEKRAGQIGLMLGKLLPKGGARESFAGKQAHELDRARIAALVQFVEDAERATQVPGVAFGVIQAGKVLHAGGVGVRQRGKPAKVDADTKFLIASNTKALATLMLAKLVDGEKIAWDTPATKLLPSFRLGDADTTSKVQVKHLICACTGMPRQDFEWLFQWAGVTPAGVMETLATMQPTSKFGELFQYSNPLAAAAGFIGGHVAYPELELGAAYDKVMQTRVFGPLDMTSTTLDYALAFRRNAAIAHAPNLAGKSGPAERELNKNVITMRPAGGAWSNVRDMLKYVAMELAKGTLPNGKRYINESPLLARRLPRASVGKNVTYGMGLMVEELKGVTMVYHGGDNVGYHSDVLWLPEHGAGAVILMNGDPGGYVRYAFRRKFLELLFDGRKEADAWVSNIAKGFFEDLASRRKLVTVPADANDAAKLASRYANDELGEITIRRDGPKLILDVGEWRSELASRRNADGTVSFRIIEPGIEPFDVELVTGTANNKRTLTLHEAQEKYVFVEK